MVSNVLSAPPVHSLDGLLLIEIGGDPYERGRQHGTALGEQVRYLRQRLIGDIVFGKDGRWAPRSLAVRHPGTDAPEHPPRAARDARCRGARVPYRDILLLNCFDDVLHALIQLNRSSRRLHHRVVKPILGWLGSPTPPASPGLPVRRSR